MYCPNCGNQFAPDSTFCSSCGARAATGATPVAGRNRIVRPRHPRMIAGVCSGFAIHYGWDVALVRILFAVSVCLTTGCTLLFYVAAWILLPDAPYALPPVVPSTQYPGPQQNSAV